MICCKCWKNRKEEDTWKFIKFTKSGKIYGLCENCFNSEDVQEILKQEPEEVQETIIDKKTERLLI